MHMCVCYVNVYFVCVNLLLLTVWKSDSWVTIHAISLDSVWSSMHQPLSLGWFLGTSTETETIGFTSQKGGLPSGHHCLPLDHFFSPASHACHGEFSISALDSGLQWAKASHLDSVKRWQFAMSSSWARFKWKLHCLYYLHYLQYTLIEREKERKKEHALTCINMH